MKGPSFQYSRAADVSDAFTQGSRSGNTFVAGGTDLLQLWKAGAMAPEGVVDISHLPLDEIEFADRLLSVGALARLSDVAVHSDVRRDHPLLAAKTSGDLLSFRDNLGLVRLLSHPIELESGLRRL